MLKRFRRARALSPAPLDADQRDRLERVGWITAPFLDDDQVAKLRALLEEVQGDPPPFSATNISADRKTASRLHKAIREVMDPTVDLVLPGMRGLLGAFITKGSGNGSEVGIHQDWTYNDEGRGRSIIVWCPLVDTDVANGTLHMISGSHRWSEAARGSGFLSPFRDVEEDLAALLEPVCISAGTAILYDAALLHGSPPNQSGTPRPVAGLALAPAAVPLIHHHRDEESGEVRVYEIDEWYYTRQEFFTEPEGYPLIDTYPYDDSVISREALAELVASQ